MIKTATNQTHLTNAHVQVIENNIVFVLFNGDIVLEKEDFVEAYDTYLQLSADGPLKLLIDFPMYTSATSQARAYAVESEVHAIAGAIVFKSLAQRLLVQSYYLFNTQKHPVKIFTNREKAIAWLKSV